MIQTVDQAILADILANPNDDSLRLILADWYMENGQEDKGELIQIQIALSKMGHDPRFNPMKRRECELLYKNVYEWTDPIIRGRTYTVSGTKVYLPESTSGRREYECTFERGFLHSVKCRMEGWYDSGDDYEIDGIDIIRRQPTIRQVEIVDREPVVVPGWNPVNHRWYWIARGYVGEAQQISNIIPFAVLKLMKGCMAVQDADTIETDGFSSAEEAKRELSIACLRWAKGETA